VPQMVSRRPLIKGFRVQSQASECESSGGPCDVGIGISLSILVSLCQCHSANSPCPLVYHRRSINFAAYSVVK
jgi:hypothetical protein